MFDGIKGVLHISEQVEKLNDKFEELIQTVQTHTEAVKGMKMELDALKDSQAKFSVQMKQDAQDFSGLKDDLRKEIADFKIIKSKMEKSIVESFEEQLKTELMPKFSKLEAHVKKFEELGSGFKLAMEDLQMRGAGNLLGVEQHGYINAVGFDLYCRLLKSAIETYKKM